ncbi:MAG: L-threonylcarbamoyladenylate synthase [Gammaproteobacteria bacterium]
MTPDFRLRLAAHCCNSGGVIAYPTESVFGLGCDPLDQIAVIKILQLKQRPVEKGLILIASSLQQLQAFLSPEQALEPLVKPQAVATSWLVKPSALTPYWITGKHPKLAVRITQHPLARALCDKTGYPLVSTSANPAKLPPARNILKLRQYFDDDIDYYVAGEVGGASNPSQIVDLETGQIVRE